MERVIISAEIEKLVTTAVDAAFSVHVELGPGLLESAYHTCFAHELRLRGVRFEKEVAVPVGYKGIRVEAGYRVDIVIEGKLLIELKSVETLLPVHKAQVITYLKLMRIPLGLLVNFNEVMIKNGIHRVLNIKRT